MKEKIKEKVWNDLRNYFGLQLRKRTDFEEKQFDLTIQETSKQFEKKIKQLEKEIEKLNYQTEQRIVHYNQEIKQLKQQLKDQRSYSKHLISLLEKTDMKGFVKKAREALLQNEEEKEK